MSYRIFRALPPENTNKKIHEFCGPRRDPGSPRIPDILMADPATPPDGDIEMVATPADATPPDATPPDAEVAGPSTRPETELAGPAFPALADVVNRAVAQAMEPVLETISRLTKETQPHVTQPQVTSGPPPSRKFEKCRTMLEIVAEDPALKVCTSV